MTRVLRGRAEGQHLGVRGGITEALPAVAGARDHVAVADHDASHGYVVGPRAVPRLNASRMAFVGGFCRWSP